MSEHGALALRKGMGMDRGRELAPRGRREEFNFFRLPSTKNFS